MIKIEISNPKIILIHCNGNQQNYPGKNTLAIRDSGVNIYLAKQATTKTAPVIISDDMTSRLSDGRTMES